ncbi:MAG: site-specific integrase, partial [Acidaminococcaceae bacterium]
MDTYVTIFLEYLTVELGLATNTKLAYQRDLRLFEEYVQQPLNEVSRKIIIAYLQKLKQERYAATTIARKLAAIKAFYRFMAAEGYRTTDPAEVIEAATKGLHLPRVLNLREVELLLAAPDLATDEGYRDRAMLELLYATGMRVSELIEMSLDGIYLQMQYVIAFGKGSKERIIPLGKMA